MTAHQAPPTLGFSRQEHWSGLPFPSPMHKVKSESEVAHSCPTLCNPMDCSLPGSSAHGVFQARVLEWVAIAFSTHMYLLLRKNSVNCLDMSQQNGHLKNGKDDHYFMKRVSFLKSKNNNDNR